MKITHKKNGFTLMEVLVTTAIIAIVAAASSQVLSTQVRLANSQTSNSESQNQIHLARMALTSKNTCASNFNSYFTKDALQTMTTNRPDGSTFSRLTYKNAEGKRDLNIKFSPSSTSVDLGPNQELAPGLKINETDGVVFEALANSVENLGAEGFSSLGNILVNATRNSSLIGKNQFQGRIPLRVYFNPDGSFKSCSTEMSIGGGSDGSNASGSGSGSANHITKWNSAGFSLVDSNIVETDSGRVGIGTQTPAAQLHLISPAATTLGALEFFNPTRPSDMAFDGGVDGSFQVWNTGLDTGDTKFSSNSKGNILVIKNNGNVGIGTVTPQSKLEVAGGIRVGDQTLATTCDINASGTLRYNSVSKSMQFCGGDPLQWRNVAAGGVGAYQTKSNEVVYTADSDGMVVVRLKANSSCRGVYADLFVDGDLITSASASDLVSGISTIQNGISIPVKVGSRWNVAVTYSTCSAVLGTSSVRWVAM